MDSSELFNILGAVFEHPHDRVVRVLIESRNGITSRSGCDREETRNILAHLRPIHKHSEHLMNEHESFSDLVYEEQTLLAERELSSFIAAVTELCGPEQARLSAENWLDESDSMASPPFSTERDWRAITIGASARLASRLAVNMDPRKKAVF